MSLHPPRRLVRGDVRSAFRSGAAELDKWLFKYAWQNQVSNNSVTYAITDGEQVIAYYSLAMAAVSKTSVPAPLSKGRPAQIPCILLARLAVDEQYQGQGLGWELLRDSLLRSVLLSRSIGAASVLVHCRNAAAKQFYLHHGDFLQSPLDELQLLVPVAALDRWVD